MKRILLLGALAVTLSSCGIYNSYKPAEEVPDALYGEEVVATDAENVLGAFSWREVFTDPLLQSLIEQGLQNNTNLLTAEQQIKEAEAGLMAAKLAYLPSFAFSPQGTVTSWDKNKATQVYSLPVQASWEVSVFGRLRNARKQSKAVLEQTHDYQQAVQTQIVAGIANCYYTLLMLDEQLRISEETANNWKSTVDAARAMKDVGLYNEAAVGQLEATYFTIQNSLLSLKEQINKVENSLSLLLAEPPHAIARGKLEGQTFPENFSVGIPVQMLSNRPDVRAAERSLEAAFYGTNQARSAFYPTITLSGSAGWTNSAGGMLVNPGKLLASAVGSLTQPLFAKGQLAANYKVMKARQEEAKLGFQQAVLSAGAEVNEAMVAYQTAKQQADLYEQQIASLKRAYESTQYLMKYGNTTYLEVLNAQNTYLSARLNQTSNRFTEIQSLINLYSALGGGIE